MTRLTDEMLRHIERLRAASPRRIREDQHHEVFAECDDFYEAAWDRLPSLLSEVRASRSAPGLREAVEALAKECESEAAAHPDSYEWAPAHTAVAKRLRSALSSPVTPRNARENTGAPDADMSAAESEIASNWDSVIARAREEGRREMAEEIAAEFRCELGPDYCGDSISPCESCAAARRIRGAR